MASEPQQQNANESTEPPDLSSDSEARRIVSTGKKVFSFYEYTKPKGEIEPVKAKKPTEILLVAFGQAEWTAMDQAAVDHYVDRLGDSQVSALEKFGKLMSQETIDAKIQEFIKSRDAFTIDTLPQKMILQPETKDGKVVRDSDDMPVMKSVKMPYIGWFASSTREGQLHSVYISMRRADPTITIDRVEEMFEHNPEGDLERASAEILGLSRSRVGEPSPLGSGGRKSRAQRRRDRSEARNAKRQKNSLQPPPKTS